MSTSHLLRITHQTRYRYSQPVGFGQHRLVIRPREGHDLRVEALALEIQPAAEVVWTRDIFGNSVACASFQEKADLLEICMDVTVRRFSDSLSAPAATGTSPYPLAYDTMEHGIITGYLTPVYPEESSAVLAWIRTLPDPGSFPATEDFVLKLAELVHERTSYQRREQKGVQTPATTLALGTGSCRDVATLMMETLRHLGVAARFASGYLDCKATRAARGSTHAWTEVYFPHLGWRGFDPVTGRTCGLQHIVTGTSHHPRGVMPVTGRYTGPPGAFQDMTVQVVFSTPDSLPGAADSPQNSH